MNAAAATVTTNALKDVHNQTVLLSLRLLCHTLYEGESED